MSDLYVTVCDKCQKDGRVATIKRYSVQTTDDVRMYKQIDLCRGCTAGIQLDNLETLILEVEKKKSSAPKVPG